MNTNPLSDDDLDRIETLLDDEVFGGDAMRLDEIQAMLCAVVSGPRPALPSVWLPEVFGQELVAPDHPAVRELIELLMRLNNDVAAALLAGEMIAPMLYPVDEANEEQFDYATWADAYLYGAGLAGDWFDLAGKHSDALSERLEPLFLLNGMLKQDVLESGERWFPPAEEARVIAEVQENLPAVVQALYDFWRKRDAGTVRHTSERPGRNDPCPCGSGRKFKLCCGRPEKLN